MSQAFTRFTVAGPAAGVDLSVPGDVTVAEALRLIGGPSQERPERWVLEHPRNGVLPPDSSLRAAGILDGETLYLRPDEGEAAAPYAEDAAEEAAATADGSPGAWSPALTRAGAAGLLAVWLGLFGPVLLWRFGWGTDVTAGIAGVLAIVVVGAVVARRFGDGVLATGLALALVPLAASFGAAAAGSVRAEVPAMICLGAFGAVDAAVLSLWLAPSFGTVSAGVAVGTLLTAAWAGSASLGLPVERGAAAVVLLAIAGLGVLPRLAVEGTGLGRTADKVSEGDAVRRGEVQETARRARASLAWLLAGAAAPSAAALAVLAAGEGAWSPAAAAVFAVALLFRARAYSHASHMLVPICAAAAGLLAAWAALVQRTTDPAVALLAALAVAALLAVCAVAKPPEITRIRIRTVLDRLDILALIACGPLLLGVFNAYAWAVQLGGA